MACGKGVQRDVPPIALRLGSAMTHVWLAVTLHGVKKSFPLGHDGDLEVLNIEELALPVGSYSVLKGPSGSGKTTLLNLVAGISVPTTGTIGVHDTDIFALPEPQRDRFRAQYIGYVFQTFNLLAAFSAIEHVVRAMMSRTCHPEAPATSARS